MVTVRELKAKLTLDDTDFRQNMLLDRNATSSFNNFLQEAQKNIVNLEKAMQSFTFDPTKFAGLTGLAVKININDMYKQVADAFKNYTPTSQERIPVHIKERDLCREINAAIQNCIISRRITVPIDTNALDNTIVKAVNDLFSREEFEIKRIKIAGWAATRRVTMDAIVDRAKLRKDVQDFFDNWSPKIKIPRGNIDIPVLPDFDAKIKLLVERTKLREDIDSFFRDWDPAHRVRLKVSPNVDWLNEKLNDYFNNYEASVKISPIIQAAGNVNPEVAAQGRQAVDQITMLNKIREEIVAFNKLATPLLQAIKDKPLIDFSSLFNMFG